MAPPVNSPGESPRSSFGNEDGFGIIEVLVSALIVVLVSLGVFTAIDAAGRTADTNESRSAASALAQTDQEQMRSLRISELAGRDVTSTQTVDGERYTVRSKAEYVVGQAGSADCSSSEEAPRYLKLTSTVTWPVMRGVAPVEADSLRAMPSRSTSGLGSLAVNIDDSRGNGAAGVSVSISGPSTQSGLTNSQGCVIFGFIPAGSYTISATKGGYVEAKSPNAATLSGTSTVSADAIASKTFLYDSAGAARVAYITSNSFGGTGTTGTTGDAYTIANSGMGLINTKTFIHTAAANNISAKVNFPFVGDYRTWAGCKENEPPPTVPTMNIPVGGQATSVNVREPRVRFTVRQYTAADNSTNAVVNGARVVIKPTSARCVPTVDNGTTNSSGVRDTILPYGSYDVCIQNKATNPTATVTVTGLLNNVANGTGFAVSGTTQTIPYLPYRAGNASVVTACSTTPAT